MYINIVHFLSKALGVGKNYPVGFSLSDQCYFYAKYNGNSLTRAFFFNFSGRKITHSKSVARCVAIIDIFVINNGIF